ncbi:MAG: hypothetical protein NTX00_03115 [Candidatus Parcubacteria bacterium]|nr:hypothetical protein [Candidatus Parcubacteria bacterium]
MSKEDPDIESVLGGGAVLSSTVLLLMFDISELESFLRGDDSIFTFFLQDPLMGIMMIIFHFVLIGSSILIIIMARKKDKTKAQGAKEEKK